MMPSVGTAAQSGAASGVMKSSRATRGNQQVDHDRSPTHAVFVIATPELIDADDQHQHGHGADLKAHAVVDAGRIVGETEAPERAEKLAEVDEMIAVVVGAGAVDLLLQRLSFDQQRQQEVGVEQQRADAARQCHQRRSKQRTQGTRRNRVVVKRANGLVPATT